MDRWIWLREKLEVIQGKKLLDLGCGSGAFTIGAGFLGYQSLGISWDERNQEVAQSRASILNLKNVTFETLDIRYLDCRIEMLGKFDVVICLETIEHILDDRKLLADISNLLVQGGKLILTTPFYDNRPITKSDLDPPKEIEDGSHVRKGYTQESLNELCSGIGLKVVEFTVISGFLSQKITMILRVLSKIHPIFAWSVVLPLRIFPPLFDRQLTSMLKWPYYSIGLVAVKENDRWPEYE